MNVAHPLDDEYFEWLCRLTEIPRTNDPAQSYRTLIKQFHTTTFHWFVPNDDNRAEDGKALRQEFLDSVGEPYLDHFWMAHECSMLEMLIALARHTAFESYDTAGRWFWVFIQNLGLAMYSDGYYRSNRHVHREVDKDLQMLNERTYGSNGVGGLFPLKDPVYDQRQVELWYQMSSYVLEGG